LSFVTIIQEVTSQTTFEWKEFGCGENMKWMIYVPQFLTYEKLCTLMWRKLLERKMGMVLKCVACIQEAYIGSEVLAAVVMNNSIFWDVTPCSPLKVNRRFEGIPKLHVPPKRRLIFTGIRGVVSQKTENFMVTSMRTSDPTCKEWVRMVSRTHVTFSQQWSRRILYSRI
jgi:hypothetical protein